MVAVSQKRIRCVVVAVPVEADLFTARGALAHEVVPGADPYVAQLIRRLQDEVRSERQVEHAQSREVQLRAGLLTKQDRFNLDEIFDDDIMSDLELPWFDLPLDDEPLGEEQMPEFGDN